MAEALTEVQLIKEFEATVLGKNSDKVLDFVFTHAHELIALLQLRGTAGERVQSINGLVDRFLAWPLPDSVSADLCATRQGYPHRTGTNLLTAIEAKAMLEYLLNEPPASRAERTEERRKGQRRDQHNIRPIGLRESRVLADRRKQESAAQEKETRRMAASKRGEDG